MIQRLSLAVILILNCSARANSLGKPLMPKNILKQTGFEKHLCHSQEPISSNKRVNTDYFMAQINCEIACKESPIIEEKINREFRPLEIGLYEGDGSSPYKIIWRSLGTALNIWSQEMCIEHARKKCLEIKEFKVTKISSGDWQYSGDYDCQRKDITDSPFDDKYKLNNSGQSKYHLGGSLEIENKTRWLTQKNKNLAHLISNKPIEKCQKNANVSTCFGDCVFESDNNQLWRETLTTPSPLGEDHFSICLDDYSHLFKNEISNSEKKYLCQKIIWEILFRTKNSGTSCASFRFDFNCPF